MTGPVALAVMVKTPEGGGPAQSPSKTGRSFAAKARYARA
jgi:hypothetical protein